MKLIINDAGFRDYQKVRRLQIIGAIALVIALGGGLLVYRAYAGNTSAATTSEAQHGKNQGQASTLTSSPKLQAHEIAGTGQTGLDETLLSRIADFEAAYQTTASNEPLAARQVRLQPFIADGFIDLMGGSGTSVGMSQADLHARSNLSTVTAKVLTLADIAVGQTSAETAVATVQVSLANRSQDKTTSFQVVETTHWRHLPQGWLVEMIDPTNGGEFR